MTLPPPVAGRPRARFQPLPASPPPELLREVDVAAQVAAELAAAGRELHFGAHPVSGRLVVEIRCLPGGRVVGEVTGAQALAVIAGLAAV